MSLMSLMSTIPISSTRPMVANAVNNIVMFSGESCDDPSKDYKNKTNPLDPTGPGISFWEACKGRMFKCSQAPSYDGTKKCECVVTTSCSPGDPGCYPCSKSNCGLCASKCDDNACSAGGGGGGSSADPKYCGCKAAAGCGGLSGEELKQCISSHQKEILACCDKDSGQHDDQNVCQLDIAADLNHGGMCGGGGGGVVDPGGGDKGGGGVVDPGGGDKGGGGVVDPGGGDKKHVKESWTSQDTEELKQTIKNELDNSPKLKEYNTEKISQCSSNIIMNTFTPYQFKTQTNTIHDYLTLTITNCLKDPSVTPPKKEMSLLTKIFIAIGIAAGVVLLGIVFVWLYNKYLKKSNINKDPVYIDSRQNVQSPVYRGPQPKSQLSSSYGSSY